jgi:hypothetical protein
MSKEGFWRAWQAARHMTAMPETCQNMSKNMSKNMRNYAMKRASASRKIKSRKIKPRSGLHNSCEQILRQILPANSQRWHKLRGFCERLNSSYLCDGFIATIHCDERSVFSLRFSFRKCLKIADLALTQPSPKRFARRGLSETALYLVPSPSGRRCRGATDEGKVFLRHFLSFSR